MKVEVAARHGRGELTASYHHVSRNTRLLTPVDFLMLASARQGVEFSPSDPRHRPCPFKDYPDADVIALPDLSAQDAVGDRTGGRSVGEIRPGRIDLTALTRLLHLSAGVTRFVEMASGRREWFRASMSAGNLHPLEIYVIAGDLGDLEAGTYHYAPLDHALHVLGVEDVRSRLARTCADRTVGLAPVSLVICGIPGVATWKYAERGWRHLYWDAGALVANLVASANAAQLPTWCHTAFVDAEAAAMVGVDGIDEYPLVVLSLGSPGSTSEATPRPAARRAIHLIGTARAQPVKLPLVRAVQIDGELRSVTEVAQWRRNAGADNPESASTADDSLESTEVDMLILRRGSTRAMRPGRVPAAVLGDLVDAATTPLCGDLGRCGPDRLISLLTVHAVDGLQPGTYVATGSTMTPLRGGQFRGESQGLCVDQRLAADAAFCVFHAAAELGSLFEGRDARAYRSLNLAAGVAAGRLALHAIRHGLGSSALTFHDDEVESFFDSRATCLLVSCVGWPTYTSVPGGRPKAPSRIRAAVGPRTAPPMATHPDEPVRGGGAV